jgi:NAD(P)-dependent dehydrogenase (short-subunit alcohol dehydrogenase family)
MQISFATFTSSTLILGGSGGLGSAIAKRFAQDPTRQILSLSRTPGENGQPSFDYADEASLAGAANWVKERCLTAPLTTVIVATGILHSEGGSPERSWSQLDSQYLHQVMLVNAIGPALALKHFAPLLAKDQNTTWAMVSARVGSIGDNGLGGWYGYRASKAALNQIVKTASIEMTRRNKLSVCVALHPGTVATKLSEPFSKAGLNVRSPEIAAEELVGVIEKLQPSDSGCFIDYLGNKLPW